MPVCVYNLKAARTRLGSVPFLYPSVPSSSLLSSASLPLHHSSLPAEWSRPFCPAAAAASKSPSVMQCEVPDSYTINNASVTKFMDRPPDVTPFNCTEQGV